LVADGDATGKQPTVEQAQSLGESPTTISGGIGYTNPPEERVSALEQYRLVTSSSSRYYQRLGNQILPSGYGQRPIYEYSNLIQSMDNETIAQSQPSKLIGENPSAVKIFERVEGANVQGSAEPNSVYTARVEMSDPNTNSTFTYRQRVETDSNGDYTFTVPYSTSGYDEVEHPPEVRANSSYELIDSEGNVAQTFEVPESAVIDEGNNTVRVEGSN
jgi:dolichyl-diphosphooligosaccharide--protein glycosyltransferase